jgi:hypothetical protein
MWRPSFILTVAAIGLFAASAALAVGSGGGSGGGAPSCSKDTYSCSDWSECPITGVQTRTCTLSDDCEYVADPKPSDSRACTPECTADTWSCGDWSACASSGTQTRSCTKTEDCQLTDTSSPVTSQSCTPTPTCTADSWECEEWSVCGADGVQERDCAMTYDCTVVATPSPATAQACDPECAEDIWTCGKWQDCDSYGNQSRLCSLTTDCSGVVTDEPVETQRCDHLQCGQGELYDRVFCRLNLAPAGVSRELELEYLPEPCRPLTGEEREECVGYYREFNSCWARPVGEGRFDCARDVLGLGNLRNEVRACGIDQSCLEPLREKVYWLVAFRFYDLEQRAEAMAQAGEVDLDVVARFVTKTIENKIAFYRAETYEERRALIEKMRDGWRSFLIKAGKL